MERLFIFAIGGTGARVLRSFTMLLASSPKQLTNYDVCPVIIDYDNENGDTDIATKCIECYYAIHQIAWKDKKLAGEKGYFRSNLMHLKKGGDFRLIYAPDKNNRYGDYIGWDTLRRDETNTRDCKKEYDTTRTKLLLQSLYNTDPLSDDAEINLKMDVGFKGNPNIGSVVFHDMDSTTQEFHDFLATLTANDRVVVIGSLFGGTGSSGVPEIIRKINATGRQPKVAAILAMPYFAPREKSGGTIRHEIFNSKTKAAINYYKDSGLIGFRNGAKTGGMVDAVYFIGDPKPTLLPYCDGGVKQVNPANIVEFICALSLVHFAGGAEGCFKYGVNQYIIGENVSVKQLFHDDLSDDFSTGVLKSFTSFAIAMKYFRFQTMEPSVWKGKWTSKHPYYYNRFTLDEPKPNMQKMLAELKSFWDKMSLWLDEMSNKGKEDGDGNTHALSLFSTDNNLDILVVKTKEGSPKYKSVKGSTIDGLINDDVKRFRATAGGGSFVTDDEEFLLMHGLWAAATNNDVIDPVLRNS